MLYWFRKTSVKGEIISFINEITDTSQKHDTRLVKKLLMSRVYSQCDVLRGVRCSQGVEVRVLDGQSCLKGSANAEVTLGLVPSCLKAF